MGFAPGPGQGGSSSIAGSSDVALSDVQDDHLLGYDSTSSKWHNKTPDPSPVIWWTGGEWRYPGPAGEVVTARPSDRIDYFFQFIDPIGDAPFPTWAIAGDTLDKKLEG